MCKEYKRIKKHLSLYKQYQARIKVLSMKLKQHNYHVDCEGALKATDYSKENFGGSGVSDSTYQQIDKAVRGYVEEYEELKRICDLLAIPLGYDDNDCLLDEEEMEVIDEKYIENQGKKNDKFIIDTLNLSKATFYRLQKSALEKIHQTIDLSL